MPKIAQSLNSLVNIISDQGLTGYGVAQAQAVFSDMVRNESNKIGLVSEIYQLFKAELSKDNCNENAVGAVLADMNRTAEDFLELMDFSELPTCKPDLSFLIGSELGSHLALLQKVIESNDESNLSINESKPRRNRDDSNGRQSKDRLDSQSPAR
jgi:hypothetical protein